MAKRSTVHGPPPLRRALGTIVGFGAAVCVLELVLVLPGAGDAAAVLVLFTCVALLYLIAGVIAWDRRPSNAIGQLLVFGGVALLTGTLANSTDPVLAVLGAVFATSVLAVIVHLLLSFPAGRLTRGARVLVGCTYAVAVVIPLPAVMAGSDALAGVAGRVQEVAGGLVMLGTAAVLVRRLVQAEPEMRRTLVPLYAYGVITVLGVPVAAQLLASPPDALARVTVQLLLLAGIPIAFVHGMLRGGFARTGELVELAERLAAPLPSEQPAPLAAALAHTLGDPSLRVGLHIDDGLVDEEGSVIDTDAEMPPRASVDVLLGGRRVGAISYDTRLGVDASRVSTAGKILSIAIDRARLAAELRASRRALQSSRARIVEAADRERFRIAQDLHDGLQAQLVLLALEAQQLGNAPGASAATSASATTLRKRIDGAAGDLRRLVNDVLPLPLTERGLASAVEDLVDRMPIPTALDVHIDELEVPVAVGTTAYFVVAEGLANALKHADADRARVALTANESQLVVAVADNGVGGADADGRGLRGIADRVDALGGVWLVDSPPGAGTRVEAKLPCAS